MKKYVITAATVTFIFLLPVLTACADKTRDEFCDSLRAMGVDAHLSERGRVMEKYGGSGSIGLIDIREGPIRWVNIRKLTTGTKPGTKIECTEYGVPDPRLEPDSPKVKIKTVHEKDFPLFGEVTDLRWEGPDSDLGIISRLNNDVQLKQPIIEGHDVTIEALRDHGCWLITVQTINAPTKEVWNCYQTIGQHLLAEWPE